MNTCDLTNYTAYIEGCMAADAATSLSATMSQLKSLILKLEQMDNDTTIYGNEGLWDTIKLLLTHIGNISLHIVHLTKTYIFKFYKSMKRTEIVYYNESNNVSMMRIFACEMSNVKDIIMPYPQGMTTSYLDALDKNYTALKVLDTPTRANVGITIASNILKAIKSKSGINDIVASGIVSADTSNIQIPVDLALKTIVDDTTTQKKKKFHELFTSVNELRTCNTKAISFTEYVDDTNLIHKKLETLSSIFNEIVSIIERTGGIGVSKVEIESTAKLAYILGDTFDNFSKCLLNFHKLEHNLVECYKTIRHTLGL